MENVSFDRLSRYVGYEAADMLYRNAIQGYKNAIEATNTLTLAINKVVQRMPAIKVERAELFDLMTNRKLRAKKGN